MAPLAATNLALRFVLELAGVAAFGYWGFTTGPNLPLRLILGIGVPVLLVLVWSVVVAPGANNPLPQPARVVLGTVLLELAAGALAVAGQPAAAAAFAIIIFVNAALMFVLTT